MRLTRRMSNATPPMIGLWAMCVICWASGTTTASEVEAQTLEVAPVKFVLSGSTSSQKLLVTANAGLKSVFDATDAAAMQTENPDIAIVKNGVVYPIADGVTKITLTMGEATTAAEVVVTDSMVAAPVGFHTEVLAALTKAGCNMGACHGSPSGKGGFRLSLRGYDPELELLTLRGE